MKVKVLFWHNRNTLEIVEKKMEKGKLYFDKEREYDVEKVKPQLIKFKQWYIFPKTMPIYALSWKFSNPVELNSEGSYEFKTRGGDFLNLELADPLKQDPVKLNYYTPQSQKALSESNTLRTLMTLKTKNTSDIIIYIAMGLAFGYLVGQIIPLPV